MAHGHQIINQNALHFLTLTTVGWLDIFTYPRYNRLIVDNLEYCIQQKGLTVYAWVLMSNHLHMICRASEPYRLSDIIRDYKSYVSKKIIKMIQDENESRRDWLLHVSKYQAAFNSNNSDFQIWQRNNHPIELESPSWILQKLNYIHNNPVTKEIVLKPEHYLYSSAMDYCGKKGLLNIELLDIDSSVGFVHS
jgi:REP element-mobilizing transposase RayT